MLLYFRYDLLTRVPTAKFYSWITHVCDALTVLLITQIHAVSVPITAPAQGDAQAIHSTLKLICMTASRRPSGCGKRYSTLLYNEILFRGGLH